MFIVKLAAALFVASLMLPQEEKAKTEGFEFLGEQTLKAGTHKATIQVPIKSRSVKWIKLESKDAGVKVGDLTIYLTTGEKEFIRLGETIDAGGESRMMPLPRVKNKLRSVAFKYELAEDDQGAVIKLWGR
jgi:hypothetical protein